MAGQSLAMGEAFGKGFQYGKRKISSMDNASFNKLDFKGLSESIATDYKVMIPSMEQSIRASDKLQSAVIQEMGDLIKSIPMEILNFLGSATTGGVTTTSTSASALGQITNVRSGGRAVTVNEAAIAQAQAIIDQAQKDAAALLSPFGGSTLKNQQAAAAAAAAAAKRAEILRIQRIHQGTAKEAQLEALRKRQTVVSSRRQAGQSQILERKKLILAIRIEGNRLKGEHITYKIEARRKTIIRMQIQLENLLKRYKF